VVSRRLIKWIKENPTLEEKRPLLERLKRPKAGISPTWFNWCLEHFPYVFQRLPRAVKDWVLGGVGSYGPRGAFWLKSRVLGCVTVHEPVHIQQIKEVDDEVVLQLSNDEILHVDHVILATGYRMNVNRLPMLHTSVLARLQTYNDAPILNNSFESNIPGLYFVGFSSVSSCGPLYRFVIGTEATALRVAASVAQKILHLRKK
jgi:hypothetical protein